MIPYFLFIVDDEDTIRRTLTIALEGRYRLADFPDAEVIISLGLRKFRIAEVPAHFRMRVHGSSMYSNPAKALYYPFKSLLASFIVLLRIIREKK